MSVPVHVSAESQTPAGARHVVPALPAVCKHSLIEESQTSTVHGFASSQSSSLVHLGGLVMQSDASEVGDDDG